MNGLEFLLRELCPNGVQSTSLGKCCTIAKGVQLNREGLLESGPYPVINGGVEPSGYWAESNYPANRITVSQGGASAGFVNFMRIPFWAGAHCFVLENPVFGCSYRYLWHCLKQNQTLLMQRKEGAGIPGLGKATLASLSIPLPPLPVQEAIVRCLDAMQEVVEALESELALRRKQYEAVRESLIDEVAAGAESKTLGEITQIERGCGLQKSDFRDSGMPCIHYGQIHTRFGVVTKNALSHVSPELASKLKVVHPRDVIMAVTSEDVGDVCKATAWLGDSDIVTGGHTAIIRHQQNATFLSHYFKTSAFQRNKRKLAHGVKVIEVTPEDLKAIRIPLPPLSVQQEIADKLDAFDELVNVALPAEIAARRRAAEAVREECFAALEAAG